MSMTIGEAFDRTTARFPDGIFLSDGQRIIRFSEASARIDAICGALLALGLKRHDRLALWLPNTPEWVMIALACMRLGVLLVTVNTRNKAEETAYVLARSKARALIMADRFWGVDYCALLAETVPDFSASDPTIGDRSALPDLDHIVLLDGGAPDISLADWTRRHRIAPDRLAQAKAAVTPDDPALAVFTSGTTGFPKGAVHSHVVLRNAGNMTRMMRMQAGDRILGHMPFYHIAGLITALFPAVLLGCTLVTVAHWQPDRVARLIADQRVTVFGGIPTHFIDLVEAVTAASLDTSCLRSAWIGGASIAPDVARRAKAVLRLDALMAAYGMTETSGCTTLSRFDDPVEIAAEGKGVPCGDFEVIVADPETGAARPVGVDGEIRVRGHIVMAGYLEDPAESAKASTADGWFRTGDLGRFDAAGYLKITGRLKDLFIVGGANVYPAEVERCLMKMPGVRQAVVVGVPDARLGEVGFAFVERAEETDITAAAIMAFVEQRLADYKRPRHVAFVDDFPMTGTRKIQRHVLVADAIARLAEPHHLP